MKLYTYFRSSATFRVRIALALKGLSYDSIPIHLVRNGGEQHTPEYKQVNPQGFVPVLVDNEGHTLYQSLAIMEYLEETHPTPALLPPNPVARARVRSLALAIACDIHPLNNTRVLGFLTGSMGLGDEQKTAWIKHWIELGLEEFEQRLVREKETGQFCHGDTPGLADCCLVPQVFNAKRFECDLSRMPNVSRIYETCMALEAFRQAQPSSQPDAT